SDYGSIRTPGNHLYRHFPWLLVHLHGRYIFRREPDGGPSHPGIQERREYTKTGSDHRLGSRFIFLLVWSGSIVQFLPSIFGLAGGTYCYDRNHGLLVLPGKQEKLRSRKWFPDH